MKKFDFSSGNQFVVISKNDFDAIVTEAVLARESSLKSTRSESVTSTAPPAEDKLLTRKETATLLHVDSSTLWRWEKAKYLCPTHVGRRILYNLKDVEDIIKKGGVA